MAAIHPNERRWGSVLVGGGGVTMGRMEVVMYNDALVGTGVEGEEGGVVVVDVKVLSEVGGDEVLNVAFG